MAADDEGAATFEDQLLIESTGLVNEQAAAPTADLVARRRGVWRPALLAAAAVVIAAAAAIVALPSVIGGKHGASVGYAVDRQSNGTIRFSVSELINDTATAQKALRSAGAGSTKVVSATDYRGACHGDAENVPMPAGLLGSAGPNSIIIDPARLPKGRTLIISVPTLGGMSKPVTVSLSRDGTPPCRAT